MPPLNNEKELIQQLAEGSEVAFEKLFNAYRNRLYAYVLKLSGSTETASDTVHKVFLQVWQRREKFKEIENFGSYLYRMAQNDVFQAFRQRAKERLMLAELRKDQVSIASFEGEDRIAHQEVLNFIREVVDQLTPQQKQVFLLSREQGMKLSEIAGQLQISERTVKNHISSALRTLREELHGRFGELATAIIILYQLH